MSIYICDHCNEMKDDDFDCGLDDPRGTGDLVCEECCMSIEEELEDDKDVPEIFPGTREQLNKLTIIKPHAA